MKVLIINCGSSSLKYQIIDSESEQVEAKGICERIGLDGRLTYQPTGGEKEVTDAPMPTHNEAITLVLKALVNPKTGVLKSLDEIQAIGHRVLHGGAKLTESRIVDDEVFRNMHIAMQSRRSIMTSTRSAATASMEPHTVLSRRRRSSSLDLTRTTQRSLSAILATELRSQLSKTASASIRLWG